MDMTRGPAARTLSAVILASVGIAATFCAAPKAGAAYCDPLLNGTFAAVSDGALAKTNEVNDDQATVTSEWTIATSCSAQSDCAGHVLSSQGWNAPINCESAGLWHVRRHLDSWVPCADGTAAPAVQLLYFSPDLSGSPSFEAVRTFSGWDRTVGVSGGCGVNRPLVIEMPFRLTRLP
ncbi:Rv2253/PknI dimerization domain-containing protein [Mycolicibacterium sp. XJ870]